MGHRLEFYVPETIAKQIITVSNRFGVDAKIIGRVDSLEGSKKLSIVSDKGRFEY
jgi:phosphoribosylformylglycinamidine cyclo-ligase